LGWSGEGVQFGELGQLTGASSAAALSFHRAALPSGFMAVHQREVY